MGRKYTFKDHGGPYFVAFTVIHWSLPSETLEEDSEVFHSYPIPIIHFTTFPGT